MSELDLILLLDAGRQSIAAYIGQSIAITFAMVIAIYYFLNRAGMVLKAASLIFYTLGGLMYLGFMVQQSNVIVAARTALRAIPAENLSLIGQAELAFADSSVSNAINIVTNSSIWAMWLIVIYLLYFWKREDGAKAG